MGENGRKQLQITDKGKSPKYTSSSRSSIPEKQPSQKRGRRPNRRFSQEDIPVANRHKERLNTTILEKCKSKLQWRISSQWSEWPSLKNLQTIMVERVWRKGNTPALLVGMSDWYSMEIPLKTRNKTTLWPSNPTTGYIHWERHMHFSVHTAHVTTAQT